MNLIISRSALECVGNSNGKKILGGICGRGIGIPRHETAVFQRYGHIRQHAPLKRQVDFPAHVHGIFGGLEIGDAAAGTVLIKTVYIDAQR